MGILVEGEFWLSVVLFVGLLVCGWHCESDGAVSLCRFVALLQFGIIAFAVIIGVFLFGY